MVDFKSKEMMERVTAAAMVWPTYQDEYAAELIKKGYFASDALDEARSVGLMGREFLEPFILNDKNFTDYGNLDEKIRRFEHKFTKPGIFVLGSGNTGLPLIINIALGILTGKTVYFRASEGNREAVKIWLNSLEQQGIGKETITQMEYAHDDAEYQSALATMRVQQAFLWGGCKAIGTTEQYLPQMATVFEFGPRTGFFLGEYSWFARQSVQQRQEISQALYDNIMKYNAAMCSSPTTGALIGNLDEIRWMIREMTGLIRPSDDEVERIASLPSAQRYLLQMQGWERFGYTLNSPNESLALFALGSLSVRDFKNREVQHRGYHNSCASLEIVSAESNQLGNIAEMAVNLPNELRYKDDLWGIGHLVTAASPELTDRFLAEYDSRLRSSPNVLNANALRVVDIRENLGRKPAESFDGINLVTAMFA